MRKLDKPLGTRAGGNMPGETLGEVATLLEDTLKVHRSVKNAVLCTKEGVVVAAVARGGEVDPRV
ncbi:MAG: hypothetical protein ACFFDD_10950, partial [Promethearchaeota archaeon]